MKHHKNNKKVSNFFIYLPSNTLTGTLTTSNAVLPIFFITSLNPPVLLRYLLDTLRRYAPPVRGRGGGPGLLGGPPVLLGP